jgi:uncharacterized Tic20 family protein
MMGLVIPIIVWVTQRGKSHYLSFQALQAATFQLVMFLFLILSYACQFFSFFFIFLLIPFQGMGSGSNSVTAIGTTIFSFLNTTLSSISCLVYLAAILYALGAAISVFHGKNFYYLILGRRIEKYQDG